MGWFDDNAPAAPANGIAAWQARNAQRAAATTSPTVAAPMTLADAAGSGRADVIRPAMTDYQGIFQKLTTGRPATPETLAELEAELAKYGIQVQRNAAGVAGKVLLPNGELVDVGRAFSSGDPNAMGWQWNSDMGVRGGPGGAATGMLGAMGLPAGWSMSPHTGPYPYSAVTGPGLGQPFNAAFRPPTGTDDPGFQFAMEEAQKAIERSAAAKGTLLTGGTLKDLAKYSTGMALQGYGDAWNRERTRFMDAAGLYDQNRRFQFSSLADLAGMGLNAASGYANAANPLLTGAGNANAASTVAGTNATNNALGSLTDLATSWLANRRRTTPTSQPANPPTLYGS